jgi:hypothetical protein
MKKNRNYLQIVCSGFICILLVASSCAPVEKLRYVNDAGPGTVKNDYFNDRTEKNIQPYDYLYIKIFSLDEKTNAIFNERSYSVDNELISYSVDAKGNVTMPFIGEINVKDLTIFTGKGKNRKIPVSGFEQHIGHSPFCKQ